MREKYRKAMLRFVFGITPQWRGTVVGTECPAWKICRAGIAAKR